MTPTCYARMEESREIILNRIVLDDETEFYPNDKETMGYGDYCGTDLNGAFSRCAQDTAKLASWEISNQLEESSVWPEARPFNSSAGSPAF